MALSLVVITGFVGQISVVQLSLAGAAGFTVAHMAVNFGITFPVAALAGIAVAVVIGVITAVSAVRVRGVSLAVVTLAGAVAIQNFGFVNTTWGGGLAGSPVPEPKWFGLDLGPHAPFRGLDGNLPSPVFGWVALICCVLLCVGGRRTSAAAALGQRMLAVRSNERAAAAAAINPRTVKLSAFTIAAFIAGVAGRAVRVQLRLGQRRPVRRGHRAEPDRVRLRGRHHADLRRGVRRPDLGAGADPVRAGQLVRAERELVPAVRRRRPDLHPAAEPRGRGRRHLPAARTSGAEVRAPDVGRGRASARRDTRRAAARSRTASRRPPAVLRVDRPVGRVRRRARAERRERWRSARASWSA